MDDSTYTVGQVARVAGVTVRLLHHYDASGLLRPSGRAANDYRTYTEDDLARLQQVLSWRELGFGLDAVATLMATDDSPTQLRRQHDLLTERIHRLQGMARTLRRTMEAHEMGIRLTPGEMFEAFGEFDPAEHADEVHRRWGDTDAYRDSARRTASYTKDDWVRVRQAGEQIEGQFAAAMAAGEPPESPAAEAAARAQGEHLSQSFYEVTPEIHQGLAQMYVDDPRFAAHYDRIAPGLAAYVRDAILALYKDSNSSS